MSSVRNEKFWPEFREEFFRVLPIHTITRLTLIHRCTCGVQIQLLLYLILLFILEEERDDIEDQLTLAEVGDEKHEPIDPQNAPVNIWAVLRRVHHRRHVSRDQIDLEKEEDCQRQKRQINEPVPVRQIEHKSRAQQPDLPLLHSCIFKHQQKEE